MSAERYFEMIQKLNETIATTQMDVICEAASATADSIQRGGVLHIFGSGHSHMAGEDLFFRAGGLASVNAMLEPSLMELNTGRASSLERIHGYANILLEGYDLLAGEVIFVVSNSGINPVPIEIAQECKSRGMKVIAVVSKQHSAGTASRHRDGLKLVDVADLIIDNCSVAGDASLKTNGDAPVFFGPTSTLAVILIMQMIVAETVSRLTERDFQPPVFVSGNMPGGSEKNRHWIKSYHSRVRYFPKNVNG